MALPFEVRCRYFYGGSAVDVLVESEANVVVLTLGRLGGRCLPYPQNLATAHETITLVQTCIDCFPSNWIIF